MSLLYGPGGGSCERWGREEWGGGEVCVWEGGKGEGGRGAELHFTFALEFWNDIEFQLKPQREVTKGPPPP